MEQLLVCPSTAQLLAEADFPQNRTVFFWYRTINPLLQEWGSWQLVAWKLEPNPMIQVVAAPTADEISPYLDPRVELRHIDQNGGHWLARDINSRYAWEDGGKTMAEALAHLYLKNQHR